MATAALDAAKRRIGQKHEKAKTAAFYAAKLILDCERDLGTMLKAVPREAGKRTDATSSQPVTRLQETTEQAGIDRNTAHRFQALSDVPAEVYEKFIEKADGQHERLGAAALLRVAAGGPHVSHNSGENEWYTPPKYIEAARLVMGSIECDPASSETANRTVKADHIHTIDDPGLVDDCEWGKTVFLNPPYAQPLVGLFCSALIARMEYGEVKQAIVLVNNATETAFFQTLLYKASAICFPKGRIRFLDPEGNPSGTPLQGQAILYFGRCNEVFCDVFSQFGHTSCWFAKETIDE